MFVILFGNLLCIPLMFLCHPTLGPVLQHFVIPGVQGGFKSDGVLLIVAIVGTTVTPWQLFFQQSNVVDKRITPALDSIRARGHGHRRDGGGHRCNRDHGGHGVRVQQHGSRGRQRECVHQRLRACRSAQVTCQLRSGSHLLDPLDRCISGRRECGHALDVVRVRRHVRHPQLAASLMARGQVLLRDVHGTGRSGGCVRPHPRCSARACHHGGAGTGRRHAPERMPLPALSVQRPRCARPLGEPALVQPACVAHPRACC